MKRTVAFLGVIVLILLFVSISRSEQSKESLYSQICRAVIRLEHHELVSQEKVQQKIIKNVADGTAFFVKSQNQVFVVTARHVAEKPYDLYARVKTKNAQTGHEKIFLFKIPKDKWIYHNDIGDDETRFVDVAVMRIKTKHNWNIVNFRYESLTSSERDKNQLPMDDAEPPQSILVFGFPANVGFELIEQYPIVRLGIISMKAGGKFIKLKGKKYFEERACLIDASIFPGNSGSPVMNEINILDSNPRLLGLVIATNEALDYAIIEPTSRIRETIDQAMDSEPQGDWDDI